MKFQDIFGRGTPRFAAGSTRPVVTRIIMDAGSQARPLVMLAHAIHHMDGDVAAATAIVQDITSDSTFDPDDPDDNIARWSVTF